MSLIDGWVVRNPHDNGYIMMNGVTYNGSFISRYEDVDSHLTFLEEQGADSSDITIEPVKVETLNRFERIENAVKNIHRGMNPLWISMFSIPVTVVLMSVVILARLGSGPDGITFGFIMAVSSPVILASLFVVCSLVVTVLRSPYYRARYRVASKRGNPVKVNNISLAKVVA